jgi:hypothetical protein
MGIDRLVCVSVASLWAASLWAGMASGPSGGWDLAGGWDLDCMNRLFQPACVGISAPGHSRFNTSRGSRTEWY